MREEKLVKREEQVEEKKVSWTGNDSAWRKNRAEGRKEEHGYPKDMSVNLFEY